MSDYQDRTLTLSKHEMVVDRHHTINIAIWHGRVIQVDGLPDDWEYTVHDVEQDTEETYSEQMQSELEPIEKEEEK